MRYYQILKQRRLDLNLSIQDVAIQTRLRPEYVRAIEENTLDVFSDDFSYVRYFVHGYCDAIGVNWNMIKDEVDANIQACAQARDQALYQAQIKMMQSMEPVRPTKKAVRTTRKKRKKSMMKKSAGRVSRKMSWGSRNRLSRLILICAGCMVLLLAGANVLARNAAEKSMTEQKVARQKELAEQEQTTQRLADDLKNLKNGGMPAQEPALPAAPSLTLSKTSSEGVCILSGFQSGNPKIHFEILPDSDQDVTILWNDQPAFSQQVKNSAQYDLQAGKNGSLTVIFSKPSEKNRLIIDGLEIPSEYLKASSGGKTRLVFEIRYDDIQPSVSESPASSPVSSSSELSGTADLPQEDPQDWGEDPEDFLNEEEPEYPELPGQEEEPELPDGPDEEMENPQDLGEDPSALEEAGLMDLF